MQRQRELSPFARALLGEWSRAGPCQQWDLAAAPGAPELHQQMVPGTAARQEPNRPCAIRVKGKWF